MMDPRDFAPPLPLSRRFFLRYSLLAATASLAAPLALARRIEQPTLSFVHTHTGEKLVMPYVQPGGYPAACLEQVSHFLRDFRTGEAHAIDPALLDVLLGLQVRADCGGPFEVISGYRSPATNWQLHRKSSGVASHSLHMQGKAIDIRLSGYPTARLRDHALAMKRGGVGYYKASDFVHVDTGRVRFW